MRVLLDEGDPVKVAALEQAIAENRVDHDVLFATGRGVAPWMASVTFGGSDLQTVYIGSLKGDRIPYLPRAGARPADGALARALRGREIVAGRAGLIRFCPATVRRRTSMMRGLSRLAVLAVVLVAVASHPAGVAGQQRRPDGGVAANFAADGSFTGSSLAGWQPMGGATWRAENGEIVATTGATGGWLIADKAYRGRLHGGLVPLHRRLPDRSAAAGRDDRRTAA